MANSKVNGVSSTGGAKSTPASSSKPISSASKPAASASKPASSASAPAQTSKDSTNLSPLGQKKAEETSGIVNNNVNNNNLTNNINIGLNLAQVNGASGDVSINQSNNGNNSKSKTVEGMDKKDCEKMLQDLLKKDKPEKKEDPKNPQQPKDAGNGKGAPEAGGSEGAGGPEQGGEGKDKKDLEKEIKKAAMDVLKSKEGGGKEGKGATEKLQGLLQKAEESGVELSKPTQELVKMAMMLAGGAPGDSGSQGAAQKPVDVMA